MAMKWYDSAAYILVAVGAINWGLVKWLNFNAVDTLLGSVPMIAKYVYLAVGVAGVYALLTFFKLNK